MGNWEKLCHKASSRGAPPMWADITKVSLVAKVALSHIVSVLTALPISVVNNGLRWGTILVSRRCEGNNFSKCYTNKLIPQFFWRPASATTICHRFKLHQSQQGHSGVANHRPPQNWTYASSNNDHSDSIFVQGQPMKPERTNRRHAQHRPDHSCNWPQKQGTTCNSMCLHPIRFVSSLPITFFSFSFCGLLVFVVVRFCWSPWSLWVLGFCGFCWLLQFLGFYRNEWCLWLFGSCGSSWILCWIL